MYSVLANPGPPKVSVFVGLSFYLQDSVPIVIIGLGLSTSTGGYDGIYVGQQMSNVSPTYNDIIEWVKIPLTTTN